MSFLSLKGWTVTFQEYLSNPAMAPHSTTLAWKIPWMEESGRLQSMRSLRVGHDWATSLSLFTFMHWRRKWQPTPMFLPGESHGQGSLVGCRLWGSTELATAEATCSSSSSSSSREVYWMPWAAVGVHWDAEKVCWRASDSGLSACSWKLFSSIEDNTNWEQEKPLICYLAMSL